MRATLWAFVLICALAPPAYAQQGAPSTIPVGTVMAKRQPISKALDFVGRVEAINRVEIRARVKGYLEAVLFKEGDLVKEGAPSIASRKACSKPRSSRRRAHCRRARRNTGWRRKTANGRRSFSRRTSAPARSLDEAVASEGEAKGAIMTNEANLQTAQINLGYTDIVAPIAGKVGRTSVTKGNVVGPDSGILTTIVSQDPMYVTFPVSQREFLRAQQTGRATDCKSIKVQAAIFRRVGLRPGRHDQFRRRVGRSRDRYRASVRATHAQPERRA